MTYLIALVIFVASIFGATVQPAKADAPSSSIEASSTIEASKDASLPTYLTEVATTPKVEAPQVVVPTIPAPAVGVPQQPSVEPATCYEDMPCWDCETMGNKQCGPVAQPATPATTCEEDMPCWDCATMGNKQCGPSVDMAADAYASFDSQTGMVVTDQEMKLSYVATVPVEPVSLEVGQFAIPSSNIEGQWHVMQWDVLTSM